MRIRCEDFWRDYLKSWYKFFRFKVRMWLILLRVIRQIVGLLFFGQKKFCSVEIVFVLLSLDLQLRDLRRVLYKFFEDLMFMQLIYMFFIFFFLVCWCIILVIIVFFLVLGGLFMYMQLFKVVCKELLRKCVKVFFLVL